MQKTLIFLIAVIFIITSQSCTKETIPQKDFDCSTVTFEQTIFPIFEQSCNNAGCHGGASYNGTFTSYEAIKAIADNGMLKTRVLDEMTMPKNGSLTANELDQIKCWLDAGAPE